MSRFIPYLFALIVLGVAVTHVSRAQPTSTKLRIVSPNGGEALTPGDTVLVHWSGTISSYDTLEMDLSADGGNTWTVHARFAQRVASRLPDTSFTWIVPRTACQQCKLRLRQVMGNLGNGDLIDSFKLPFQLPQRQFYSHHYAKCIGALSDLDSVLIIRTDTILTAWDIVTGEKVSEFILPVRNMSFGIDPKFSKYAPVLMISASPSGFANQWPKYSLLYLWNYRTGEVEASIEGAAFSVFSDLQAIMNGSFSPDESKLVIAGAGPAKIWDRTTRTMIDSLPESLYGTTTYGIYAGVFTPDGQRVILGSTWELGEYDLTTHERIRVKPSWTNHLKYSEDGKYFLSSGFYLSSQNRDHYTQVLDAETWDTLKWYTFKGFPRYPLIQMNTRGDRFLYGTFIYSSYPDLADQTQDRYSYPDDQIDYLSLTRSGATVVGQKTDGSIYVYDISRKPSDETDGTFSIQGTLPIAVYQYVGSAQVGKETDTLIRNFVIYEGRVPLRVDSVVVVSGHATDFTITSGAGPYTLQPGEKAPVGVSFTPADSGLRSVTVEVRTENGNVLAEFYGIGVLNSEALPVAISKSFGSVTRGESRDSTFTSFLVNNTAVPIEIDEVVLLSGHTSDFSILSNDGPTTLAPNGSAPIGLRFTPSDTGLRSVIVEARTENGNVRTQIYGLGVVEGVNAVTGMGLPISSLHVSPNPAVDRLTIRCRLAEPSDVGLSIYDAVGRLVDQVTLGRYSSGDQRFDYSVQQLGSGAYRLEIRTLKEMRAVPFTIVR